MQASSSKFSDAALYINRELSLLEFNRRVLAQSLDDTIPLLERLRFLCIASSNLDEFFEIRVAGLKQQEEHGSSQLGPDRMRPHEQLLRISEVAHQLVDAQYHALNRVLLPLLDAQGFRLLDAGDWTMKQSQWVKRYFNRELLPMLSPMGLDPAHPFPRILNKSLNFIVSLKGKDAFGRSNGMAIVQAPRALPRVVALPSTIAQSDHDYVLLSSIIQAYVSDLFPGMTATGCFQFRITRNSDLFVDDEEVDDLLRAMVGELEQRNYGAAVRLEIAHNAPQELADYLSDQFNLAEQDIYRCQGPVNLARLMTLPDEVDRPDLKFPDFVPSVPERLTQADDIFTAIRGGDILLHHPFQSFNPVVELLRQAAADPKVLAIRQTLYRTGPGSAVVAALVDAADRGKEVAVVIELRARFDEEANIELATTLQERGCHVAYGVVGHKTHAKMSLVVRREGKRLRRYAHLGTGNYHARTARLYTDYGLLTCDEAICEDAQKVFQQLMSLGQAGRLKKMLQSPFTLHRAMVERIRAEATLARSGRPGHIMAKMNSLIEPDVIAALYAASCDGVKVDLIVRGICALRPGLPGVSENITVRSIIGRFLEHTRVFYFGNGHEPKSKDSPEPVVFLSSADWMGRNFFHRIETCFPIEDAELRNRIIEEAFSLYLVDNSQAWALDSAGEYRRVRTSGGRRRVAQQQLLDRLATNTD